MFQNKVQNLNADKRQLKKYTEVLGKENVPKSIEAFQEMKYNKSEKFKTLRTGYNDVVRKEIIKSDKTPKNIHHGKQDKHIRGSANYIDGRSYLTISNDEIQELVNQYAGTGEIIRDSKGRWKHQEVIKTDRVIGISINDITGISAETKALKFIIQKKSTYRANN